MKEFFKGVVKLTEEQYVELKSNGSLTVGDTTITFDENTLYVTDYAIDSALNANSQNPVTNSAITRKFDELSAGLGNIPTNVVTTDTEQEITATKNFVNGIKKNGIDLATVNDIPAVADTLSSESSTSALSAKQGKLLNDKITSLMENSNGRISSFTVQGLSNLLALFGLTKEENDTGKESYAVGKTQITYNGEAVDLISGDVFFVVDTEVPDYWYSLEDKTLYQLETRKIDLSVYALKTELPTTLPASDVYPWAKAEEKPTYDFNEIQNIPEWVNSSTKPTYTASEVGALSALPSNVVLTDSSQTISGAKVFEKALEVGKNTTSGQTGISNIRMITNDSNNVHEADFYIDGNGYTKITHKNRSVNSSNPDSYIYFNHGALRYGTGGESGTTATTEYDIITSKGGKMLGDLSINGNSSSNNRATLNLVSEGDNPTDLKMGSGGNHYWSLTSRASDSNYNLGLYNYAITDYAVWIFRDTNKVSIVKDAEVKGDLSIGGQLKLSASGLKTSNGSGYDTDQYGNIHHTSTGTSDNLNITNNAGTSKFQFYYETGVASFKAVPNVNGTNIALKTDLNSYLPLNCSEWLSGDLKTSHSIVHNHSASNVLQLNGAANDSSHNSIVIYTKIKFVSSLVMPTIRVKGYHYRKATPFEFNVCFYIYDGGFINQAVSGSIGRWRPEIYLFKYTEDDQEYVALGLKTDDTYFVGFEVGVHIANNSVTNEGAISLDNWRGEFVDGATSIPSTGTNACTKVSYCDSASLDGDNNVISSTYLKKTSDKMIGTLTINGGANTSSWHEGLFVETANNGWATVGLGYSDRSRLLALAVNPSLNAYRLDFKPGDGNPYQINIPAKSGTLALTSDLEGLGGNSELKIVQKTMQTANSSTTSTKALTAEQIALWNRAIAFELSIIKKSSSSSTYINTSEYTFHKTPNSSYYYCYNPNYGDTFLLCMGVSVNSSGTISAHVSYDLRFRTIWMEDQEFEIIHRKTNFVPGYDSGGVIIAYAITKVWVLE